MRSLLLVALLAALPLVAACDGDDGGGGAAPTGTPAQGGSPAPGSPETSPVGASGSPEPSATTVRSTPVPTSVLPSLDGVIVDSFPDYLHTDSGDIYGVEGLTPEVETEIVALRGSGIRVRLHGTVLQPVPDAGNRLIRVERITRLGP